MIQALVAVPLRCSDHNGDLVSYEITAPPHAGLLGAIDQSAVSVLYSSLGGFCGIDGFRYRGVAAGLTSADADVTVAVAAPASTQPAPSPSPTAKVSTVASLISYNWRPPYRRPTLVLLSVRQLPARATIQIVCSGKPRCPFKTKRTKRGTRSTLNLLAVLRKHRTFRAGQTVDVRISAPGQHTKVMRFKINSRRGPNGLVRCIRLGRTRVRTSC